MDFSSDNAAGAAPAILEALAEAAHGTAPAYGEDPLTKRVEARIANLFECDPAVFLVATGSAANALALATLTPSYGAVLCHEASHIQMDECGAPEFFSGGAKLIPLPGFAAKLTPETVEDALRYLPSGVVHHVQARCLSLTQSTECGTVYTPDEIRALCDLAHGHGLRVHMDGARFANAAVALGLAPADLTWRAGVDVLVLGATKNGALGAEAVIFFDKALAGDFVFRRKRAGHLISKSRFIAAQVDAYLAGDLWLTLAAHANDRARELAAGLSALPGAEVVYPCQANEVFAALPDGLGEALLAAGARFYPWVTPGDPAAGRLVRMVTSFQTSPETVSRFLRTAQSAVGQLDRAGS